MSRYGRLLRISSAGEISVGALRKPSFTLQQKKKPCPTTVQKPKPVGRPVFTPGSPVSSIARSDQGITNEDCELFLQSCFQCKKQFGEKDDLFMYGYLRAFCSLECREKQMTLEEKDRSPSPVRTDLSGMKVSKNLAKQRLMARH